MICVSIGRGKAANLLQEHQRLVDQGAELVEWRLDYLRSFADLADLVAKRPGPAVATCRREKDGGRFRGKEEDRLTLLRQVIVGGVDYVDLEEDVAANVPRYGETKRVVSLHDFRKTPEDLEQVRDRLAALDADVVKIAAMAQTPRDNLRMLAMVRDSSIPVVGLCMGEMGTPSRILAPKFGAAFTFATFNQERPMAPGQISHHEMTGLYGYNSINAETEVYGVIGDPIAHSYSPLIHNAAFQHLKLNKVYLPFRVPEETLHDFLDDAPQLGVRGLSVTIPHKGRIPPKLTEADELVQGSQASNTIVWDGDRLLGYNTDIPAALEALKLAWPSAGEDENPFRDKSILILGAGGVAKGIAFGLIQQGAEVVICGRTRERAAALADHLGCKSIDWGFRGRFACKAMVNCTSVGMHPNIDESPMEKAHLKPTTVVLDTVYNPEKTVLIKQAQAQRCKTVTGIEMFVRQAAAQFRLFTDCEPPLDVMRDVLRQALAPVKS
ncbi:MAG: shikimate dehydrogenase [Planctomycetales bacterium]